MTVIYNDKTKKYEVRCYYKDITGKQRQKTKRGFKSERQAIKWEKEFKLQIDLDLSMPFDKFVEVYMNDKRPRLKHSTWHNKKKLFELKILPFFKNKPLMDIKTTDIIHWQNQLIEYRNKDGKAYSQTYLRTINNQLSALFNHAVRFYDLQTNVMQKVGTIGKKKVGEMQIWSPDEYKKFLECIANKPQSYYAFEVLYWTGIREGELLALTKSDFDFNTSTLSITKSYYRYRKEDYITTPKTDKSVRNIKMPGFLLQEMKDYFHSIYYISENERIFPFTKSYLYYEMKRGVKAANIKKD